MENTQAIEVLNQHYDNNHGKLIKRMTFRSGTVWSAEDIVQEAYYRALLYIRSCEIETFSQWFSTILNNTLREYKNQEKGYSPVEFDEDEDEGTQCTNYSGHVMAQVYELIETKSLIQIEILMLFFHQEYTARDISRITDYKYAQIHQIIYRFRQELKDLYE